MNWKYKLELKEDRDAYDRNDITLPELSKRIAAKIRQLPCISKNIKLQGIATKFEGELENEEDFNNVLNQLYDWGDVLLVEKDSFDAVTFNAVKQCWVGFAF